MKLVSAIAAGLFLSMPACVFASDVDYVRDVRPILQKHCYSCHGEQKQKSSYRLDIKSEAFKGGESYGASIVAGEPQDSPLIQFVADDEADLKMPPEGKPLSANEIAVLTKWVKAGAAWPDGVDLAKLEDKTDHWSFKPLTNPKPPATEDSHWSRNDIDRFILTRIKHAGLEPAAKADRVTWLRRVYFDLIGLPPSPEQVADFLKDQRDDAYDRVVEELLKSPRYGERWAQHWLDVVRYADTHGFEVNTERPNAWPYRDYVIAAFNNDTPYDQFIHEQLVGDALSQDAATGFLVTAAVLLPGQIGKDDASKRLARQDSLAEMLINTGEAFLGLSIGCARCHDHKFDPITQRDYYSMQAFLSGVQYGDRQIATLESEQQRRSVEQLKLRLAEIDLQLARFQPLARIDAQSRQTNAKLNTEQFEPLQTKFVRFTIHDANLHPTLGLIEPCIDEFEIFTAEDTPRNIALAEAGTRVTASGSRTSAAHRLEHINDGKYGNSRSWMSNEAGRGWVLFELPAVTRIERIVWGRDRDGNFQDRLATAFTLEAGLSLEELERVAFVPPMRPSITATSNVDRFAPVTTRTLRFTIEETNSLEPCIDELEVFNLKGENVALAASGTTVKSSGNAPASDNHKLEHINDGKYGNSRSWMSSETGRGWVEFTFSQPQTIDRVVWARDREGKFSDRLAVRYSIEVGDEEDKQRQLANANDRFPIGTGKKVTTLFSTAGLLGSEVQEANQLLEEKNSLEAKINSATRTQLVYGGRFTKPENTHLLFRGDPEQPRDEVTPTVIEALGAVRLPQDAAEQQRRQALADWIADSQNPLTARVMVNRVWQWHFGTGIVETSSDFGRNGAKPSHPELLDWLAGEFIRSGWSVKHLHRLIVLSETYRQTNRINRDALAKDADVRLLWRFPARRLEAEAIRDSMLAVSGRLNLKTGGPGFDLFKSRGGLNGFPPIESFSGDGLRRLIYAHKIRMEREIVFGAFDCPDAGQTTALRRQSTTPIQALNLFNSRFTIEEADAFAARVKSKAGAEAITEQIRYAYRLAYARGPDDDEIADAESVVRGHGLATLCRAIFNSNEFLFLP